MSMNSRDLEKINRIGRNDASVAQVLFDDLDDDGMVQLWLAMQNNTNLTKLSLRSPALRAAGGLHMLINSIQKSPALRDLEFTYKNPSLGDQEGILPQLFRTLASQTCSLTHLRIQQTPRSFQDGNALDELRNLLHSFATLITHLSLPHNDIQGSSIPRFMTPRVNLKRLELFQNPIGDSGAQALATVLAENPALQDLMVASCQIGVQGITALMQSLKVNTNLNVLDVSGNHAILNQEGGRAIAEALPFVGGLRVLHLQPHAAFWVLEDLTLCWHEILSGVRQANHNLTTLTLLPLLFYPQPLTPAHHVHQLVQYYLGELHRRVLRDRHDPDPLPLALWPYIFERVNTCPVPSAVLYDYLRNKPDLWMGVLPPVDE